MKKEEKEEEESHQQQPAAAAPVLPATYKECRRCDIGNLHEIVFLF